jgi:hypothetical protein
MPDPDTDHPGNSGVRPFLVTPRSDQAAVGAFDAFPGRKLPLLSCAEAPALQSTIASAEAPTKWVKGFVIGR